MPSISDPCIEVVISPDRCLAELVVPPDTPPEARSVAACQEALRKRGIPCDAGVLSRIEEIVGQAWSDQQGDRAVVARGELAVNGDDGFIKWFVRDPGKPPVDERGRVNHYERSAFVMVDANEVIGQVVAPTAGRDGRDVAGSPIRARPGKGASVKLDGSIFRDGTGQLIARKAGVLHRAREQVLVRQLLEVGGNVDFSTGNIDFKGNITIRGSIGDLFRVTATGDIEVFGLIEAAKIRCGGDLIAHGGMCGYGDGDIRVEGSVDARYLNNVRREVKGDLRVQREIINCELKVLGAVDMTGGAVIGGWLQTSGDLTAAVLGSRGGVQTRIIVPKGVQPRLEILKHIFGGVSIAVGRNTFHFNDEIRGPIRIYCRPEGKVVAQPAGSSSRPLAQLPGVYVDLQ